LGCLECFFLGLNYLLGGNFFLNFTLNNLDGVLYLSNEIFEVLDLFLNDLLLVGEKIVLFLGGDFCGEHLVLRLDVLLKVLSELGNLLSDLVNCTLGNNSSLV
jgi:hypothetical protein